MINQKDIIPEALDVLKKLHSKGYQAYLVGGGIRDLILGKKPKDFDVVTNATPDQVKVAIRRCRIIGRRFRLVHAIYPKNIIIEIATFRKPYDDADNNSQVSTSGMILRDNEYGTSLEDDAIRRDLTINALYYSPFENEIHDFHGGLYDLINQNIDIIGNPEHRFHEDPVRIIRAYRFAAKLGFHITQRTKDAIPETIPLLTQINSSRMFEEFNKLFLTGHGAKSFELLMHDHVMSWLLTDMGPLLKDRNFFNFVRHSLENSDERFVEGKRNMPHFLYAMMLWPLTEQLFYKMQGLKKFAAIPRDRLIVEAGKITLNRQSLITKLPILAVADILDIWKMQIILASPEDVKNAEDIVWQGIFRAGLEFLTNRAFFSNELQDVVQYWTSLYEDCVPPDMRTRTALLNMKNSNELSSKKKKSKLKKEANSHKNADKHKSSKYKREKVDKKEVMNYFNSRNW